MNACFGIFLFAQDAEVIAGFESYKDKMKIFSFAIAFLHFVLGVVIISYLT